jgi:hypothetical protein
MPGIQLGGYVEGLGKELFRESQRRKGWRGLWLSAAWISSVKIKQHKMNAPRSRAFARHSALEKKFDFALYASVN